MSSNKNTQPVSNGSYTEKLALAAGSLSALALLPMGAQASIINTTLSASFPMDPGTFNFSPGGGIGGGPDVLWDFDGHVGADLQAFAFGAQTGVNSVYAFFGFYGLFSASSAGAGSFNVSTMSFPISYNYLAGTASVSVSNTVWVSPGQAPYWWFQTSGGYLGWMQVQNAALAFASGDYSLTFDINYAFENCGPSIHVGQDASSGAACTSIPEPPMNALVLLGLGAAGVARWRRGRKSEAASA